MSNTNEQQAFPMAYHLSQSILPGMALRDHFAAKAMNGWISCSPKIMGETLDGSVEMADVISQAAYTMADAMLKAREA
jgi:hypothetical protein